MSVLQSRGYRRIQVTIANGASLSGVAGLGRGVSLVGIVMPAAWTTAGLSFQASADSTNFADLYDSGSEYTVAAGASRYIQIPADKTDSIMALKVRSGTTGTPVNQGADRVITLIVRDRV
jgi:hypothetical protein